MKLIQRISAALAEARPVKTFSVLERIKNSVTDLKIVTSWTQADGVSGLFRDTDGQAYEITIRPAAAAVHPGINQEKGSGKGWRRDAIRYRVAGKRHDPALLP